MAARVGAEKGRLRGIFSVLLLACLAGLPAAQMRAAKTSRLKLFTFTHSAMATVFTLYLYSDDVSRASTVSEDVFDEVDRVEQELSNYRETSELSRVNRAAAKGPITTDPEMMDFLEQTEHWSRVSGGAFDVTVGRLMKAWGFYRHEGAVPPAEELERLRSVTGWQKVRLNTEARTVRFMEPGVELDPGGIGKGFAVDAAVRILRADGVQMAMLSAGGSTLYGLGAPPGLAGWRVIVPGPLPSRQTLSTILLRNESLSSADCSQKNFTVGGHVYCHIMDPLGMRPVEGRIQVSVIDPSATASDALSNVVFVQSPERSLQTLMTSAPEARALIVSGTPKDASCATFRWTSVVDHSHCAAGSTSGEYAAKKVK